MPLFISVVFSVHALALDLPTPFTLNLPVAPNLATPSWLGQPDSPAATFATLNLPILTPDPNASLLVTVYFQEKPDGFMRIIWQGTQAAQVLSDNFYENIGMANQRSLLISPSMLVGDGVLTFQCGDSTLGIQRIKFEWLESKTGLGSPTNQDVMVTPAIGPTQSARTLNGAPIPAEPGAWDNQIVTVPLSDQALRIEQGVEFNIDLDKVPNSARLALQETGLPLGKHLVVWINQQRAGTITPAVPDLLDGGFLSSENAAGYVGWRDGSFYVPVSLLKVGVNAVQFSDEDDTALTLATASAPDPANEPPLAIKALLLQLNYTSTEADTGAAPTSLSTTPTGPVTPADTSSPSSDTTTP